MNILLFMMGGKGSRFGAAIPKQYTMIDGSPLFLPILKKYQSMPEIDKIVIVSHSSWLKEVKTWCSSIYKLSALTVGGKTRSESIYNGIQAMSSFATSEDIVLIHDATHPYVDIDGTRKVIEKTVEQGAATLGNFNYDTVYRIDAQNNIKEVLPRSYVINGASPEAFKFNIISKLYENARNEEFETMTSAGAMALANGIQIAFIETEILNLKITYHRDLELYLKLKDYFFK